MAEVTASVGEFRPEATATVPARGTAVPFELVTPERLIISREVEMVVVPGTEGNFGVLPGHAPFISTIRPGTVDIYQGRVIVERIFVVGGIAEVTPERCTVLADEAMPPEALDRGALDAELTEIEGNLPSLREQIGRAQGTDRERLAAELRQLERRQTVARAKLQALAEINR
jgi:F-type H+-transporting ATPase subunit epsilon